MKYEEAIKKLEEILSQLKSGQMPLSELTEKVKEAGQLIEFCKKCLTDTQKQVDELMEGK